jgi:hypothetical protein
MVLNYIARGKKIKIKIFYKITSIVGLILNILIGIAN